MAAAAASLSACASSPEDIAANAVSPAQYEYMTCAQLSDYATALNTTYEQVADRQNEARTYDMIGYVVLQQPVGSERNSAVPAEISELKGRLAAVQSLQNSKSCSAPQQASLAPKTDQLTAH